MANGKALASYDSSWGTELHPVGGGWLVLWGPGLYVNRAMAVGLDAPLSTGDLDLILSRSVAVGVSPAVEVGPTTAPETVEQLRARGFAHQPDRDVIVLTRPTPGQPLAEPDGVSVRPVTSPAELAIWQETSALGWGHTTMEARRASDAYAATANATEHESLFVAFDATSGQPIGCAGLSVNDGIAVLGGASVVPSNRRRGVQTALIHHRVGLAADHRCWLVATSAAAVGQSRRNLRRHGFVELLTVQTHVWSTTD